MNLFPKMSNYSFQMPQLQPWTSTSYHCFFLFVCDIQLKSGQQIPSPSELMGKILIKNKKGSHEKTTQTKKNCTAATDQTTATAASAQDQNTNSQDPANPAPSTQENQGGLDEPRAKSDCALKTDLFSYFSYN